MKKFILTLIGSFFALYLIAQDDLERRSKLVSEVESFLNAYTYYTTIKSSYAFQFELLSENYFSWDSLHKDKFYFVEDIISELERNNQIILADKLKENHIKSLYKIYEQYRILMIEKELFNQVAPAPWTSFPYIVLNDSIIDLSSCFWQKTEKGYKLTNSIDTLKKFDPWRQQKPKNKESVGKELTLRYYNYQDTTITTQMIDSFQNNQINKKNKISSDIYGLVNSEFYRKQSLYENDVPVIIRIWIQDLLFDLKKLLPKEWNTAVRDMTVSFTNIPNETLWFKSDKREIYLSPFLIRAVYIKHIYEIFHGEIQEIPRYINNLKNSRQRTLKDDIDIHDNLKKRFQRHFYFLLLHELAHPIINNLKIKKVEEMCDCKAAEIIINNNLSESLGIFEEILIQSIKEGSKELWSVIDQVSILNRLTLLKNKEGKLFLPNCSTLLTEK